MKTIAVDLDDVLNDFTETLQRTQFVPEEMHALSEEAFQDYLAKVRSGWTESNGLLSTDYSFFRYKIHQRCYERARARTDGVNFMKWLRQNGWRIVICTYRDLRRAQDCTRKWLGENEIPFDYLFMTKNKIAFCKAWGIEHLIDDEAINITLEGSGFWSTRVLSGDKAAARSAGESCSNDPPGSAIPIVRRNQIMDRKVSLLKEFYRRLPKDRAKLETEAYGFDFLERLLTEGMTLEYGELTSSGVVHKYKLASIPEHRMDGLLLSHVEKACNVCLYFDVRANDTFCFNLDNNHVVDSSAIIPEMEAAVRELEGHLRGLACEPLIVASGRGYHVWGRLEAAVANERLHDFMLRSAAATVAALHRQGYDHHQIKFNFYPDPRVHHVVSLRLFGSRHVRNKVFSYVLTPQGLLDESASWEFFADYLKYRTIALARFQLAHNSLLRQE